MKKPWVHFYLCGYIFWRFFSPRWLLVIAAESDWKEVHFFLSLQKQEALRLIVKDRTIISIRLHLCKKRSSLHHAHGVLISTLKPIQSSFNGQSHKLYSFLTWGQIAIRNLRKINYQSDSSLLFGRKNQIQNYFKKVIAVKFDFSNF